MLGFGVFFMWNPAELVTETVDPSLCCFFTVSSNIWKTACLQSFHNIILHLHHVLSGKSFLVFSRKKKRKRKISNSAAAIRSSGDGGCCLY